MAPRTVGGSTRQSYDEIYADAEGLGLDPERSMSYAEVQELLDQYGDEQSGNVYDPRKKDPFRAPRRRPVDPSAPVLADPFGDGGAKPKPAVVRPQSVPLPDWITDRQSETSSQVPVAEDAG